MAVMSSTVRGGGTKAAVSANSAVTFLASSTDIADWHPASVRTPASHSQPAPKQCDLRGRSNMLGQLSARDGSGQGRAVHAAIHGACLKHWALSAPPASREIVNSNISLSKEDPMKPTRWIAAVAVAMWCLAGGSAMGAEDKSDKAESH